MLEEKWGELPLPVLLRIFLYLNPNDRGLAARTCKNWSNVLHSPVLWRCVSCRVALDTRFDWSFSRKLTCYCHGTSNALRVLQYCTPCIRCLWLQAEMNENPLENYQHWQDLRVFFKTIAEAEEVPQLHRLHFTGSVSFCSEETLLTDIIYSLVRFLALQRELQVLQIEWLLTSECTSMLINALKFHCSSSLKELYLYNPFPLIPTSDVKILHKCLNPFTNLHTVSVSYNDVCENLLKTLASNCRLQSLCITCKTVNIFTVPKNLHSIPDVVWKEVKQLSPQLKVGLILGFANWTLNYLRKVLSREVPLVWFHYDTDVPKNNCIQYLKENFCNTLEDVNLNFVSLFQTTSNEDDDDDNEETDSAELSALDYDEEEEKEAEREARKGELYEKDHEIVEDDDDSESDNDNKAFEIKWEDRYEEGIGYFYETPEKVDESLIEFVQSCTKLTSLKVWGRFDLETLDRLCTLKKENKIGLQCLHMYFFDLSTEQRQFLDIKKDQYNAMNLPFQNLTFYEIDIDDESEDSD